MDKRLHETTLITQLRIRINDLEPSREKSLALTKLEECEMWLEKAPH